MLFRAIRAEWARHVASWNRKGIHWRQMTTAEILWMVHEERISYYRENDTKKLRPYLISMKDEDTLLQWDREMMASKSKG